jgi:hypothetical protein
VVYNTQEPTLSFPARWHVRWKTNNTYTNALAWSPSWVDANWTFSGDVYQSGDFIELRIPLADVGAPTSTLSLAFGMLNEQGGVEASYAGVPSTTYVDSYDPDFTKYLVLPIGASTLPSASAVLP